MRLLAAILLLALAPATAAAYFEPGAIVVSASLDRRELADDASQVADVSADGRYVVFQTRATNFFADDDPDPEGTDRLGGVFRRDLQTGALELVAAGDLVEEDDGAPIRSGARNPSVSADGRYVAFSTAYALVPGDTNEAADVYVRDMTSGTYELVSARDGTSTPAAYADPLGADIWPLTSISDDGRTVVFRTLAASDLPAAAGPTTAAGQVLVRDLDAATTRAVSVDALDGSPAGGAAGPTAISADATTVLWTGHNARPQTRFLSGEPYDSLDDYYLWRRIADGPAATTRRITGLSDPDDPACPPDASVSSDPAATGPCFGPQTTTDQGLASISGRQLALSADGWRIWFLTPAFPRPLGISSGILDLWSTDMRAGLSRKAATVELTREGAADDEAARGGIDGISVSGDGRWLAFSSRRTKFVGGRLLPTGPLRTLPDQRELYLADLETGTVERALTAYAGTDADGGDVGAPVSISADGTRIAFVSGAANLFFGDANNRPDAFVVRRTAPPVIEAPPPVEETPNPDVVAEPPPDEPRLRIRVRRGARRAVVLSVTVPSAGRLSVRARGRLPAAGGKRKPLRTFATAGGKASAAGTVKLTLKVAKRFVKPLRRYRRLGASARVTFVPAAGGPRLLAARQIRLLPPVRARQRGRS